MPVQNWSSFKSNIAYLALFIVKVVVKCQLFYGRWGAVDRSNAIKYDNENHNTIDLIDDDGKSLKLKNDEFQFLQRVYDCLKETLICSRNDSTTYSKNKVLQSQIKKSGSSLESPNQRSQYVSLCTLNLTSEVLNISFKKNGGVKATSDQVLTASDIVIQFLFSFTAYKSEYSLLKYKSAKLAWDKNSSLGELIHVPGGLLFPLLTLLLISYLSDDKIHAVAESYGGKDKGVHVHYEFGESLNTSIPKAIEDLKKAEENKISFTIINAFRKIQQESNDTLISNISLHLGIGCDAMGAKLQNGDTSFLVCSPVTIDAVDKVRNGPARQVFIDPKESENVSVLSRVAADENSDSDSDSDSDSVLDFNSDSEIDLQYGTTRKRKTKDLSNLTREAAGRKSSSDPIMLRHRYSIILVYNPNPSYFFI
jgi:hypothetical protein